MKSPLYEQEESTSSIAQRLLQRKKLTQDIYGNKTAQERRINKFGEEDNARKTHEKRKKNG